jgi:hypothetical protein
MIFLQARPVSPVVPDPKSALQSANKQVLLLERKMRQLASDSGSEMAFLELEPAEYVLGLCAFHALDEPEAMDSVKAVVGHSYAELAAATGGFAASSIVGRGRYGPVYRGELCGQAVAIKRLDQVRKRAPDTV